MESVYTCLNQLRYYGKFTFTEAYNLPIALRNWHIQELVKIKEAEAKANAKPR